MVWSAYISQEGEVFTTEEEESTFEEEEVWPDNTTNREEIINATAMSYEDWAEYVDNIEFIDPDIPNVDWNNENQIIEQIAVTIEATQLIYNTKKYRLEA